MPKQEFKSAYERIKSYLAKSVTAENTEEITELSKDLDTLQDSMVKEEEEHTKTKDKLVDYVKNTAFKKETVEDDPEDDSPKTMEEAEKIALKKLMDSRKKNNKGEN